MLDFLQQLFQRRGARPAGWQPAAAPSAAQARRYRAWLDGRVYRNWTGAYFHAYHALKGGLGNRRGPRVELLREDCRQGALLFYDPATGADNFAYLYQWLGERVAQLGYHRACHDRQQRRQPQRREQLEKQLFKPDPSDCAHSGRCNQRFGLIHLDLVQVNGAPLFIRLSANPLRGAGSHFTPAESFDALLAAVLDEPAPTEAEQALAREFA